MRHGDVKFLAGARDGNISQPAFFFQGLGTAFVHTALVRKQTFFPAGKKNNVKLQTFAECRVISITLLSLVISSLSIDQTDVLP